MHRLEAWLRVRGRGYRMDPDEKPGVWWADRCTLLFLVVWRLGFTDNDRICGDRVQGIWLVLPSACILGKRVKFRL